MDEHIDVDLSTDDNGFISQECPACGRRFKIVPDEGSDKTMSFCPYCQHEGHDCWWTPEQAEYLAAVVGDRVIGPRIDQMAHEFNRSSSDGFVQISMQVSPSPTPVRPRESNEALPIAYFACCDERIKHDGEASQLACIICGVRRGVETT